MPEFDEDEKERLFRLLERIAEAAEEIAVYLKLADQGALQRALAPYFSSGQDLLVYRYSDGDRSSREIARLAGTSHVTVVACWKRWNEDGLVEASDAYKGRFKKKYYLRQLVEMVAPED